jgi:hypothetical protein
MIICASAMVYWIKQLKIFEDAGTENKILPLTLFFLNKSAKPVGMIALFKDRFLCLSKIHLIKM